MSTSPLLDLESAIPALISKRDPAHFATDAAAAAAIAQAAVSVELFTIPLYMSTMYSIQGTHQINSKNIAYYQGRQWPGAAPTAKPETASEKAFNLMFSVFIQEMLHLQMASNIATAIGVMPDFTTAALMNPQGYGWTCYGPDKSVIPHIVDLKDTTRYQHTRVNLEALNDNQIDLLCAIEQPEHQARHELRHHLDKYFPSVPLANWQAGDALPMFGTIGHMYECLARYLTIEYHDGQTLWAKLRAEQQKTGQPAVQQDLFNTAGKGHPQKEYPHCPTLLSEAALADAELGLDAALDMMVAITDQGEGHEISVRLRAYRRRPLLAKSVAKPYREDRKALEADYPSYDGAGQDAPSADAEARATYAPESHYERFELLRPMLKDILTWAQWHAQGHVWSAALLTNAAYHPDTAPKNIPAPEEVAGALNRLKAGGAPQLAVFSKVAVGAIAGVTSVLNDFWQNAKTTFPYPSMAGSGDRIALCWAVFGQAPDLSLDIGQPDQNTLYHACQGLDLNQAGASSQCAAIEIYHTCRGSNGCHAQGGCGFVQDDKGGGSCSALRASSPRLANQPGHGCNSNGCGGPSPTPSTDTLYSAPSDNKCKSFGGCAVPISASQLFPDTGSNLQMKLYDFAKNPEGGYTSQPLPNTLPFAFGEAVYDKAWEAYSQVLASRQQQPGEKPKPSDLRLALPPST